MIWTKTKYVIAAFLAFIVCMGAFLLPIYASDGGGEYTPILPIVDSIDEAMIVNATWLDAEMLRIDVTDLTTGVVSSLAIRLSDFISGSNNSPYVLIQAADLDGNLSGVIQISNPFYIPADDTEEYKADDYHDYNLAENGGYDGAITSSQGGLTPDGTGTVVDNVVTQNEIEFFTVYTEEGNVFFLVIDRQRNTDNVYLLNAVTEADLMALAESSGNPAQNNNVSAIPPIENLVPPEVDSGQEQPQEQDTEPDPPSTANNSNGNLIIIGIVAIVVGGVAYYFKIIKPKQNAAYDDEYDDSDSDDFDDEQDENQLYDYDLDDGGDEQ